MDVSCLMGKLPGPVGARFPQPYPGTRENVLWSNYHILKQDL